MMVHASEAAIVALEGGNAEYAKKILIEAEQAVEEHYGESSV